MLEVGDFVVSSENDDGIGKIVALQKNRATVEYFYSIGKTQRAQLSVQSLRPIFPLPRQTRCYFRDELDNAWRIGRIGVGVSDTHEVLLPEQKRLVVSNERLYVRCSHPVDDPLLEILAHKGHETPRFHDWRFGFVSSLLRQRAATRGMSGLISSKIELFPHQVEVVRRVLEDPVQRYLLADEVGLGKTIEAGAVLRQYLLDDPDGVALIIVPPLLQLQWEDELRTKFDIEVKDERVVIATTDKLPHPKKCEQFGFLIVDEAQHAAGGAFSTDPAARKSYRTFNALCDQIPRVLLLSATPVLHHEKAFLAMLHLLDSEQHQLKDVKKFSKRVQNRQTLGRLMLTFTENSSAFALKSSVSKLKDLFRGEKPFKKRCKALEKLLAVTPPDPEAIKALVRTLRTQAAEGLRVHRRMLRTRRESIDPALLIERSMQAKDLHPEPDMGGETETLFRALDDWRKAAWTHEQTLSPEERAGYAKIYLLFLQAASSWEELFKDLILARKNRDRKGAAIPDSITHAFPAESVALLTSVPSFPHEKELLQTLANIYEEPFEDGDRLDLLMLLIKPFLSGSKPGQKAVVFSSFTPTAQTILKRIRREGYNESKFAGHTRGMPYKDFEKSLEQFRAKPDCTVFVGDATCEEGLNLQFATHAIHFDLPLHPNRLEQRIGRLDRIARSNPLTTTVLTGPDIDESPQAAWFELLRDGLSIFEKSIASLQFFVESLMPQIETALFENGAAGLRELKEKMPAALGAERLRIAEQEVLDSIDVQDQEAKDFHKRLEEDDQRYDAFRRGVHGWVHDGLRFGVKQGADVVEYFVDRGTLIPAGTVVRRLSPPSKRKGTFRRVKAVYGDDLCLFRVGEPFIDALAAFTDWDDRGQAFAMWRHVPALGRGKDLLAFRLNYIAELSLAKLDEAIAAFKLPELAAKSFKRQGDAFFPPVIHTLFMDAAGELITDPAQLQLLSPPFHARSDGGSDYNLAKERLTLIDAHIPASKWERVCAAVRKSSEQALRSSTDFKTFCAQKLVLAERETHLQLEQLKLRGGKGDRGINLSHEKKLREALLEGIRAPRIKLDSCGFYIVSSRPPPA